jgi:hypothetical protein
MALLFVEGFDHYGDTTYMAAKGWSGLGSYTWQTGRSGSGQCLQQGSPSNNVNARRAMKSTATTLYFGVGFRTNAFSANRSFFGFATAAGSGSFGLSLSAGGKIQVENNDLNGSVLATCATTLVVDTWYYIEGKVVFNGASSTVRIVLNGVEDLATTTVTLTSTAAGIVSLVNEQNSFLTFRWDDIYVCDESGSGPATTYLGDVKVETLFVTADGTNTAWAASAGSDYQCVDETTGPNGDTDYISSSASGDKDTFVVQDLSDSSGTVYGVQTCLLVRKDDAGARAIRPLIRQGGTDYDCGVDHGLSLSYQYVLDIWDQDPTAANWTVSNVNADEFGVKVTV